MMVWIWRYMYLVQSIKKGEFQSGEDCSSSNRDGMGWG